MATSAIDSVDPHFKSPSKGFLVANGVGSAFDVYDIEMVTMQPSKYTSLKDLIPTSSTFVMSSLAFTRFDRWREIAIKDPLVKQAALSYLQPMSFPMEVDRRSFVVKVKDKCLGCFGRVNDVAVMSFTSEGDREDGGRRKCD